MNYHDAILYLNSLINFEFELHKLDQQSFSLQVFQKFCDEAGNPQHQFKCIHIAGSKGKGSTAALTAEMLKCAGYRVGLYTSPHLYDVRERIRILLKDDAGRGEGLFSDCIPAEVFSEWAKYLKNIQDNRVDRPLTYYEFLTVLAFLYFQEAKADIVVLETGLGGRLDATNVVKPLVCGITLIDLEHTQILGHTLAEIAREKAGIIKPGCRAVSFHQESTVDRVLQEVCDQQGVELIFADEKLKIQEASLIGDFQKQNTAIALAIVHCLKDAGFFISDEALAQGIKQVIWPARMELVSQNPTVIIDGAHTPASIRFLFQAVQKKFPRKNAVVILGMSLGKEKKTIAQNVSGPVRKVILTKSSHERADTSLAESVGLVFQERGIETAWRSELPDAIDEALENLRVDDIVVVTGSLFLAAEVRAILKVKK